MVVWSEVDLGELAGDRRLDAEYYEPSMLRFDQAVKSFPAGWKTLREMAELITDGDHLKRDYQDEGVLFLTAESFSEHRIDYHSPLRISPTYERTLARARSEAGAVFLTKTGRWYGKAAVCVRDTPIFNIPADVAKIRLRPEFDPSFLACYLNAPIGYALVRREASGASRDRIVLENLRALPVPIVTGQDAFRHIVVLIDQAYQEADRLYAEAESTLKKALGLDRLDLAPRLFFEGASQDVMNAGRFDAEYSSPRSQNLIAALKQGGMTLEDVAPLANRPFRAQPDVPFNYIEIGDIQPGGTAVAQRIEGRDAPSRAQWIVQPGDIVTATVRPIRRLSAIIPDNQAGYVCSSGFAVLEPTKVEPEVLLTFLRLPLVCELLDLHTTASMYPAISTTDLLRLPIGLPPPGDREAIVARVQESLRAKREGSRLLKEARELVERAVLGDA